MQFKPFKEKTIKKEFAELPSGDFKKLQVAMRSFTEGLEAKYQVKDYGDGIKMITDAGRGQGRCIFFFEVEGDAIIVKVYKKESQKASKQALDAAKARKKKYEQDEQD